MESEGSLPRSQQPTTIPHHEPDESNLHPILHPISLRLILNITLPSTIRSL
jgi:hypothetical protein